MSELAADPLQGHTTPARRWLSLGSLCLALLVVTLDNTVLNVVLPTLVRELDATSGQLQWVVDAYVLVFAGLLLVAGSLADRVGRKHTFVAGMAVFLAGSVWAAFADSVGMLIAARAFMGLGAAFINPSTLSIVTNMFTDHRERQRAFGIWAATAGLGIALGPITGGFLLAHFWWGSVFLINVPIVAASLLFAIPLVPNSRNPVARRTDLLGCVLSTVGLSLLLWSIIEAPDRGWSSALVVTAGAAGLVVLAGFVAWERRTAYPMLNLVFFRSRPFSAGITTLAFVMVGGAGALFVMTQYLQFYLGYSALRAGVLVLPAAAAIVVVAPFAAPLVRAVGGKIPLIMGLLVMATGLWQLARVTADTSYPEVLPYLGMLGIGMGLVLPTATSSIMNSLPSAHTGVGSATNSTFMQTGTALGVAVIGSLLATRYQDRLGPVLAAERLPADVREGALGSLGGALGVAERLGPAGRPIVEIARSAFLDGVGLSLGVGAIIVFGVALIALGATPAAPKPHGVSPGVPAQASVERDAERHIP